ncbi:MAG TPA: hypothetical protein VGA53_01100 [Candidatus Paceibacterota bacterium]
MAHGKHCHCMMCSAGKKMGMIGHEDEHGHDHDKEEGEHKEACPHCGDTSGKCNCG